MTFEEGMKQSIEELVEKKTALEKRCFELEQENETLKMGLQYDSDNRDDVLKENSDLQQKFLDESYEKSKLENINLKLCEQNNELVEENGILKTQIFTLQGINKGLKELVKGYENTRDRMIAMGFPTFKSVKEYSAKLKELEAQIEKLINFILSKTECCDVCPITDTCINDEGTCPYAGILAKDEEEVTREWLMQFISKEIKE
jgi:chromosome segregation ATPase